MLHLFNKINDTNRYKVCLLLFCLTITAADRLVAQSANNYALVRTPLDVTVNRTVPKDVLAAGEAMPAKFSTDATDEEIFRVHFFEEPLVPATGTVIKAENAALVNAMAAFSQRTSPDDFTAITNFIKKYPKSRWKGSLLANIGIVYRRTGYYNEAMYVWEQSWNILKKQTDHKTKVLADRVISELLLMNGWIGRKEKLDSLFKEIEHRIMEGPASERVVTMRHGLWLMKNKPQLSFMCGPYALNKIYRRIDSSKGFNEKIKEARSSSKGFSLSELEKMAINAGMNYQMAFRKPGSEIIPNAVVHWKLNHYSALLKAENGHYKCEDATTGTMYGQEFWLTPSAFDSSASGYFLVRPGALPAGWRKVLTEEGNKIFGKGMVPPPHKPTSPCDPQLPASCGGGNGPVPMAQSNIHAAAVSLHIFDVPVFYTPPVGPAMIWHVDYIQRDSYQPANFTYSNMGPKWTFNWLSYVQDDPTNLSANADIYIMSGGVRTFTLFNAATQSYAPELQTNDVLVRICPNCYELRHPNGSKEVYARTDGSTISGRKIFLTKKIDIMGNVMHILYDANLRIVALKDTIGQVTTISYGNASDIYKITKVTDPFGRFASFRYDAAGRLNKITDMIGILSSFKYDAADFIESLTTPYGTTSFIKVDGPGNYRSIETHYPLGEKEKVAFSDDAREVQTTSSPVPLGMNLQANLEYLAFRNTFYWDKKAMKEGEGDYSKAKIYHWLHGSPGTGENGTTAPLLESIKEPLENRVWYKYDGQPESIFANQGMSAKPSLIGRILEDGSTQLTKFYYNELGADTLVIDPVGRQLSYKYDNNKIDLLEIRQTKNNASELLAKYIYNSQHLPVTAIDVSGLTTSYTYNTMGQVLTIKNPKNETTTYTYNANGYLLTISRPVAGSTTNISYDGFGRIRTVTDPEGYTTTVDYDVLNRPTIITYPDNSFEQIVYDRLDAVHKKDRLGRWSHSVYDSLRRVNVMQDALGRVTQYIWCSCGSLAEIVDPLKQVTTFVRDLQGRVTSKIYPDGKSTSYTYENTSSRLKEETDAKGQKTQYSYFIDNNPKQVDYVNAQVATPSVSYTYDAVYNRINTMTDGTGTTSYAYKPVNSGAGSMKLLTVDGPMPNDVITYNYDPVGRLLGRSINGVVLSVVYDALGRTTSETNALGSFAYNYLNQTERLSSINFPNGQSTVLTYFDNPGDQLLKQIWNKAGNSSTLSKFDYEYNKQKQITKWTQQVGIATPAYYEFGYDLADELTSATQKNQTGSTILKRYDYQYDKAGNRISEQVDNSITSSVYNNVNQLTTQQNNGPMRFAGSVSKFSTVLVKNQTSADSAYATVDTANKFEAFVKMTGGNNNIAITATDYSGNNNNATNNYSISVTAGANNTLVFDNNGNTTYSTIPAISYNWDAKDRLVKITKGGVVTEFVYDGLNRWVAEKLNGNFIKRWLWDGTRLAEERDGTGTTVTKRFFTQGEQLNGINYYFTKDHLNSIREMIAADGISISARYDYDPYGRRTKTSGNLDCDFGYTGYYSHATSGLQLALFRAYDADKTRWLNRDPIAERGGMNLYDYVKNNPINLIDPLGLEDWANAQAQCIVQAKQCVTDGLKCSERSKYIQPSAFQSENGTSGNQRIDQLGNGAGSNLSGGTALKCVDLADVESACHKMGEDCIKALGPPSLPDPIGELAKAATGKKILGAIKDIIRTTFDYWDPPRAQFSK